MRRLIQNPSSSELHFYPEIGLALIFSTGKFLVQMAQNSCGGILLDFIHSSAFSLPSLLLIFKQASFKLNCSNLVLSNSVRVLGLWELFSQLRKGLQNLER